MTKAINVKTIFHIFSFIRISALTTLNMGGAKQVLNFGAGPAKLPPEVSTKICLVLIVVAIITHD